MTIATAIMALTPNLYWPLDDGTGPAADDVSGNGHFGIYYGGFGLRQPGPETGTFAALFQGGGGVKTPSQSPVIARPYSLMCFVAPAIFLTPNAGVVYNGNGSIDGAGVIWAAASAVSQPVVLLHGGQGQSGPLGALTVGAWHHVAVSEAAGGNAIMWVDNAQVFNTGGNNPNPPGASSPFQVNSPILGGSGFYAHAALFTSALTNADVNSVFTASPLMSPSSTLPIAPGDIATIDNNLALALADLAAILAAVRKTY